ncbi:hypothetical protein [Pseudoduganella sp. UC29_71]|uniref:hypothetical protein n=1 Tax=Pseudoduganella sp. UC29_71 TaxID=3350174 RepID=UPI00366AC4F8
MERRNSAARDQRRDAKTAAIVQHALALLAVAGVNEAQRYLRQRAVPVSVVERVLAHGRRRVALHGK